MNQSAAISEAVGASGPVSSSDVQVLTPAWTQRWDEFVEACPQATFCHRAGWKEVIEKAFGHRTYYLFTESRGKVTGILPLGHVKSRLFANALISTPYCMYGGIAARDETVYAKLESAACSLAQELNVDYLELRNREARHPDWPTKQLYVTFSKALDPDPEKNLLAIPRKQRAMVRKGINAGLQSEFEQKTDRFYSVYSQSYRSLGTPVFSRAYIDLLREVFKDSCDVLTVTHNGELVSSVLSFYFRDEVLPYYAGGTDQARLLKGNDFMYWELMRRSCDRGCRVFDFGRSKQGTGSYSFKKNWGFEPSQLHYEYFLVRSKRMPDFSPMNPKYRLFISLWKRLPLSVTRVLGPLIARQLG